jgi:RNA polymerase sigma-70 factor, ECF subfamily
VTAEINSLAARESRLRQLIVAGCSGNQTAYAAFLKDLSALLRGYFRKRLSSLPDEVEDLVQEVLIAIHNQRHTYDASQPVTAWAHAIARFKMIDFFRRRNTRHGEHIDIDDAEDALSSDDHLAADAKRDIATLLADLPIKQREAIEWVKIEGLSIAEAAAKTGQSESSIKVGIHRGLKALGTRMREIA